MFSRVFKKVGPLERVFCRLLWVLGVCRFPRVCCAQTVYRSSVERKRVFSAPSGPFLNRPNECCLQISGFRGTLFVRTEVTNSSSDFVYLRENIADCVATFQENVSLICQEKERKVLWRPSVGKHDSIFCIQKTTRRILREKITQRAWCFLLF